MSWIKKVYKFFHNYFTKNKEIDVILFKVLGTSGAIVSVIAAIQSFSQTISGGLINLATAALSVGLLWFVDKTDKYVIGYLVTTAGVFMGLFTALFLEMGGLDGSIPYFFMFALVYTSMMYKGVLLVAMESLLIAYYSGLCVYAYMKPEVITPFETDGARFTDQMVGILVCGVGIGIIFYIYILQYKRQQRISEEAGKAKSQFLANMSHEIRTPINMMLGMNEMIYRESDNEIIKEYASNADEAGKQLLFEINQVLQFSKLDANKEVVVNESYSLGKTISNMKHFYEKEAAKKNLEFTVIEDKSISRVLVGDMRMLSQILTNLLSNAIKYTKEGSVTLIIKDMGKDDKNQKIYFAVKDTGIGIKEENLEDIFKSFARADHLKNRSIEGTGLGLAISANLAKMLGTHIDVESVYGAGSTFGFEISQEIGDDALEEIVANSSESFVAPDAHILVVDDNAMNLNVVKSLLKKTLVNVDTASGAEECYRKCSAGEYQLILMDLMMPDIDGIEAMKHLRQSDKYSMTPIVVLTADVSPGKREQLLKEGFDGYLSKPIDWHELEGDLIKYLPENLVTKTKEVSKELLSPEEIEVYASSLKKYDVELSEGLRYVGGDILQYTRVADYFVKNAEAAMTDLSAAIKGEDLEKATLIFHSLKGNARNVGSIELNNLAKYFEKRSRNNDIEYVLTGYEVVELEWKRVQNGLTKFLEDFRTQNEKLLEEENKEESPNLSPSELLEEILTMIDNCKQAPAIKLIDELIRIVDDDAQKKQLEAAKESISQIEFEEAEVIIKGITEGK